MEHAHTFSETLHYVQQTTSSGTAGYEYLVVFFFPLATKRKHKDALLLERLTTTS